MGPSVARLSKRMAYFRHMNVMRNGACERKLVALLAGRLCVSFASASVEEGFRGVL